MNTDEGRAIDASLAPWEKRLAIIVASGIVLTITVLFLASPELASGMLEYGLKFVPLFVDGSGTSIFDFYGAGDPRGRIVTSLFTWININVRQLALLNMTIHPAMSVSWLLYPATLVLLYHALRRMSEGPRYPVIVTLLYAASPGMLDVLCDYFLPAKALMNFWFVLALYAVSMFLAVDRERRPVIGATLLSLATLLGLLSDETAIFIPICISLLFARQLLDQPDGLKSLWLVATAFALAFTTYACVVLVAVPLANAALGQAPLDLPTSVLKGPYAALMGEQPRPLGNLIRFYSPVNLLETLASAHFVPNRTVIGHWTYHEPLPWFFQWSIREQLALYGVLAVLIALARRSPPVVGVRILPAALALLAYVFLLAFALLPLSGYLTESGYYAALGSLLIALLVGRIAAAPGRARTVRMFSWALVVYLVGTGVTNTVASAYRHPYLGAAPLTWSELAEMRDGIALGKASMVIASQPFPSRRFLYAWEAAAAFEAAQGRRVDFLPMQRTQQTIARFLNVDLMADSNIAPAPDPAPANRREMIGARLLGNPVDPAYFRTGTLKGEMGNWGYRWRFDGSGAVLQRAWRYGLMRVWTAAGRVVKRGDELCLEFPAATSVCFASLYEYGGWIVAYDHNDRLVTRFRWEP